MSTSHDAAAFQAARDHFKQTIAEIHEVPARQVEVHPHEVDLPNDTLLEMISGPFFAFIANLKGHTEDGWEPVNGFATAAGEIVIHDDLTHLGALIRATGALSEPPTLTARELTERLLFIFPRQGFLIGPEDGYAGVAAPTLRSGGGEVCLQACVLEPEEMGLFTIWRLTLTLAPSGEVTLEREEVILPESGDAEGAGGEG